MTRRLLFLLVALLLFSAPSAHAINEGHYPAVLMDTACTDTEDTPAAETGGARPALQISGSGDGFCDHDSRIVAGAVTADTLFGPFSIPADANGVLIFVDADVVSNDTDTWRLIYQHKKPHDVALTTIANATQQSTEGDKVFSLNRGTVLPQVSTINANLHPPAELFITLDLVAATSWDGSISLLVY